MRFRMVLPLAFAAWCSFAPVGARAADDQTEADQAPDWTALADCAAGYLANWRDRQGSPDRTKEMADMIRAQSDQYKTAAAKAYQARTNASESDAAQIVDKHVQDNLERFVTMDKAGKLIAFIDECPQADDSDQD